MTDGASGGGAPGSGASGYGASGFGYGPSGYGASGQGAGGAGAAPPTCPRHPGVVSYVRCQRCGRPACPQCQRPAAVGIQCVDCVNEAARRAPRLRTVSGARARQGQPVVTYSLMALCVVAFLAQQVIPSFSWQFLFSPAAGESEPWRFLTAAFLHGGIAHIAFNMYALFVVGPPLERALGRWRFLALYLVSALGGSVAVLLLADPSGDAWRTGTYGASGAVFGIFAAMALTMRRAKASDTQFIVLIVINFALGLVIQGVSWQAHLGGLVTGAGLAALYLYWRKSRSTAVAVAATAVVVAALVALAVVKYAAA